MHDRRIEGHTFDAQQLFCASKKQRGPTTSIVNKNQYGKIFWQDVLSTESIIKLETTERDND